MRPLLDALRPIPGAFVRELRALTLHGPRAREPLKAVLSVLLAVTVATVLRLDDLSWAAFSGYMVMRADIAESIPRGLMRTAGTIGGAVVSLLLAPTVADTPFRCVLDRHVPGADQPLQLRLVILRPHCRHGHDGGPRRTGKRSALRGYQSS